MSNSIKQLITTLRGSGDADLGAAGKLDSAAAGIFERLMDGALNLQAGHQLLREREHAARPPGELDAVRIDAGESG